MAIPLDGFPEALLRKDEKEYMMGIDEAGRGPTLGPMVYGSAFCAVEDEARMKAMGFMDSKQLTEAKRDQLWAELQACASFLQQDAQRFMDEYDEDGNGQIEWGEIPKLASMFMEMDLDCDGYLSLDELMAYLSGDPKLSAKQQSVTACSTNPASACSSGEAYSSA